MRGLIALLVGVLPALTACPALMLQRQFDALPLLPPAALGDEAARAQRLTVTGDGAAHSLTLDAAVEAGPDEVRMAGFLLGQRVLLVAWDGQSLEEVRAPVVPSAVDGRGILRDLQLVYWPAQAIRQALPRGWQLEETPQGRRLLHGTRLVFESQRSDSSALGGARMKNHLGRYAITIESADESR